MTAEEKRHRFWKRVIILAIAWIFVLPLIALVVFGVVGLLEANAREEEKAPLSDRKVDNGELSQALSRSQTITGRASESMVQQALDRRSLRGRFVDGGEVRDCLSHAGWSQNHIDFLFYRSQHEHVKE